MLIGTGDGHGVLEKIHVIFTQDVVLKALAVLADHLCLANRVKHGQTPLLLVGGNLLGCAHTAHEQLGHFAVNLVDLASCLLQKIHNAYPPGDSPHIIVEIRSKTAKFGQTAKGRKRALDLLGRHAIGKAHVAGTAEIVRGDQKDLLLLGALAKGVGVPSRGLDE